MTYHRAGKSQAPIQSHKPTWWCVLGGLVPEPPAWTAFGVVSLGLVLVLLGLAWWSADREMLGQVNYAYALLALLLALFMLSWPVGWWSLRRLEVTRAMPREVTAGEAFTVLLSITNRSRFWPALAIEIEDRLGGAQRRQQRQVMLLGLSPGEVARVRYEGTLFRRGLQVHRAVELRTRFPFGLLRVRRLVPVESEVLVRPTRGALAREPLQDLGRVRDSDWMARPTRGSRDEFYGVREFQQGDTPREISWKASARRGKPVTSEYASPQAMPLLVMLDTRRTSQHRRAAADVEFAISLAATLAEYGLRRGRAVGLVTYGASPAEKNPTLLPPRSGKGQFDVLLNVLAELRAASRNSLDDLIAAVPLRLRREVHAALVLPGPYASARREVFEEAFAQVSVYSVQDPLIRSHLKVWDLASFRAAATD